MLRRMSLPFGALGIYLLWSAQGCTVKDPDAAGSGGSNGSTTGTTTQTATSGPTSATSDIELTSEITTTVETTDDSTTGETADEETPERMLVTTLPADFTAAPGGGGYKIVGALDEIEVEQNASCVNIIKVVVRDFLQSHLDFGELKPAQWMSPGLYENLLLADLDPLTRKPTANPSRTPADVIESFDDWYVNTPASNKAYVMDMWLQPDGEFFVFDTTKFFPLEEPWNTFSAGDEQSDGIGPRNFLFTTEIHTAFEYKGTEVFNFRGDDDVWIYVNNKLAVDIGGIHSAQEGNIDLGARGAEFSLTVGQVYNLDMFQAERNPVGSNFRIQTSLDFKECGVLPDDIIR